MEKFILIVVIDNESKDYFKLLNFLKNSRLIRRCSLIIQGFFLEIECDGLEQFDALRNYLWFHDVSEIHSHTII